MRPDRSRPAPRPQPLLRHRHRLHLRRALLLVRPQPRAHHAHRQGLAPGRQLPRREPRLQVRRAVQPGRGGRARRLQRPRSTPTARRLPTTATASPTRPSATAATRRARRLRRRHRAGQRPALAQPRRALRLPEGLLGRARPARRDRATPPGSRSRQTDFFTWNTISPRIGFNLKLTKDGRTALKGHWGRYHRAVATGEYANMIGPSITPIFVGPLRHSRAGPSATSRCRDPTRTWASTRTTRARTRTSSS